MKNKRITRFRFSAVLCLTWLLWTCAPALARDVLLLHSDPAPTPWNQRLASGLIEGLGSRAGVQQAFLPSDSTDEDAFDAAYDRMSEAMAGKTPDAVVTEGDIAFAFARKFRDLFPNAPLIFCAMDRPNPRELSECGNCTGIPMTCSVRENVNLIFAMRPETRLLVAIVDGAPESARIRKAVNRAMEPYLDRAQIMFPGFEAGDDGELNLAELGDTLASVPSSGAVLFLRFTEDRDGNPVSNENIAALIRARAASPIFLVNDAAFGSGAVGGLMIPAKNVGENAARVALKVLDGVDVREMLPVSTEPVMRFDGTALARFGLHAPDGAEVVNPPAGKVEERSVLPVTGLAWALGLAALVVLAMLVHRRPRFGR
ncbi:hypothetical protein LF599_16665 [Pseudodesulfovibrio thermohalotolerans]|uniref:ABC transporter substrate-binding protein n=1 Tax=Pseudodesulfovibrio thermohalotolerans TaxID=2880651 RepID=UPI0022B9DBF5|nr:hypothetical protein [Pseudodesulfovibrio thermohalotolerans]WFS62273.1 hypothetical protein LF599_16665 [Pseudodesulfovibrio thermohalotolerans]